MCVENVRVTVDTKEGVATAQDEWSQPVTRKGKKKAGGEVELIQAPGDTSNSSRSAGPPAGSSSVGRGTPRAGVCVGVCVHVCVNSFSFSTAAQHTRESYGGSVQVSSDQQRGGGGRGRRRTQSSGRGRNRGERGDYSRGERGENRGETSTRRERDRERSERLRSSGGR